MLANLSAHTLRFASVFFALLLGLQPVPHIFVAQAVPPAAQTVAPTVQELPQDVVAEDDDDEPILDGPEPPVEIFEDTEPVPPDTTGLFDAPESDSGPIDSRAYTVPPLVPIELALQSEEILLTPGEQVTVTLRIFPNELETEESVDAQVSLQLPPELTVVAGGSAQPPYSWSLSSSSWEERYEYTVVVELAPDIHLDESAVLPIYATATADTWSPVTSTLWLGAIAPETEIGGEATSEAERPATALRNARQGNRGAVLASQDDGILLLAPRGALPVHANLSFARERNVFAPQLPQRAPYADIGRDGGEQAEGDGATAVLDTPSLFLPVTSTGGDSIGSESAREPMPDDGLLLHWSFDATAGDQPADDAFTEPMLLRVSAKPLLERGVDLELVNLWTREDSTQSWRYLPSDYDATRQEFVAWLYHFSEFGLQIGGPDGDYMLPTMKGLASDLQTGGASYSIPIEAPDGVGGLNPNLSLVYSSLTVNDVMFSNGNFSRRTQASMVGYGWSLAGMSYIARVVTDPESDRWAMVFNGVSVEIFPKTVNGTTVYVTRPAIFATIRRDLSGSTDQWRVVMPDGTTYIFGGTVNYSWPSSDPATRSADVDVKWQMVNGTYTQRVVRWHLRRVLDALGNRIVYNYISERGAANSSNCPNAAGIPTGSWYTKNTYLTTVEWNGKADRVYSNNASLDDLPNRFRIELTYATGRSDDNQIAGACQPVITDRRLDKIRVKVLKTNGDPNTAGDWHTLRGYTLGVTYPNPFPAQEPDCDDYATKWLNHMALSSVQIRGEGDSGDPIQTYTFTYRIYPEGSHDCTINNVRLNTAANGFGGVAIFSYKEFQGDCFCDNYKPRLVSHITLGDGLGDWAPRAFAYSRPTMVTSNGVVDYLGVMTATVTSYAYTQTTSSPLTEIKHEHHEFYFKNGSNIDPRKGKPKRTKVFDQIPSTATAPVQETYWAYAAFTTDTNGNWVSTASSNASPLWVRLEEMHTWTAGVGTMVKYLYEPAYQAGAQFGNVTTTEEWSRNGVNVGYSSTLLPYTSNLSPHRATRTNYQPNDDWVGTDHGSKRYIVNQPARVRVYDISNYSSWACKSESRIVYWDPFASSPNHNDNYTSEPQSHLPIKTMQAISGCDNTADIANTNTNWAVTLYTYDIFGNPTSQERLLGAPGATTNPLITLEYDEWYRRFPIEQETLRESGSALVETARYFGVVPGPGAGLGDSKAHWGSLAQYCRADGMCDNYAYDDYGRVTHKWERSTLGNWNGSITARWSYAPPGTYTNQKTYIVTAWQGSTCAGNFTRSVYNGLGQLVQEQRPLDNWMAASGGSGCAPQLNVVNESDVNYLYDALGRQIKVTPPLTRVGNDWPTRVWATESAWTGQPASVTTYDALDRVTSVRAPNGQYTYNTYSGRQGAVIAQYRPVNGGPDRVLRWQQVDGLGRPALLQTRARNTANTAWETKAEIALTYDVLDNLLTAEQTTSNNVATLFTNSYNAAGWRTQSNDLHLGLWNYAYDRLGRLVRQNDARYAPGFEGNANRRMTTCLYYDRLSRVIGKEFRNYTSCQPEPNFSVTYAYDQNHTSSTRSLGKLTEVAYTNGNYVKTLAYNNVGLLASEAVTIQGAPQSYTTQYAYDAYARPVSTTYPDGEVVTTNYNSRGLPKTLNSSVTPTVPLIKEANYDEAGRPTTTLFGVDASTWQTRTHIYAPWGEQSTRGGLLERITVRKDATQLHLKLIYTYDPFGNVASITDGTPTYSFTYDPQNRIRNAYGEKFNWWQFGTFDSVERADGTTIDDYSYNTSKRHQVLKVVRNTGGTLDFTYDNNGNMLQREYFDEQGAVQRQTLEWNRENRLSSVSNSSGVIESYLYDDAGIRVKKTAGSVSTYYVGPHYEVTVDGANTTVRKYYFFNGQRIGVRDNGLLHYIHGDHLGSTVITTKGANSMTGERYYAYGTTRSGGVTVTDHTFTGQKKDATGLMYYNARYYDPQLGAFISPDTIIPDPGHVFGYNRYMYSLGNPVKFNDPSGHHACATENDAAGCYQAHGVHQDAGGQWTQVGEPIFTTDAWRDAVMNEAGITFSVGDGAWGANDISWIAQGIVMMANKIHGGADIADLVLNALGRLNGLLGGAEFVRNGVPPAIFGNDVAAYVGGGQFFQCACLGVYNHRVVIYDAAFVNADFARATAVHELAHVMDFNATPYQGLSAAFPMTAGFDAGDYIDAVQLGIQQGNLRPSLLAPEYFAEIVAIWVFEGAGAGGINPYAQLRRSENAIRLNERRALEGLR